MMRTTALFAGLLLFTGYAVAQPGVKLKTYTDSKYGVSFRYPADWQVDAMHPGEVGGLILPSDDETGPFAGKVFAKSRSMGSFEYRVFPGMQADACLKQVKSDEPTQGLTIGGRKFTYGSASVPATGQSFEAHIYATVAGENCYLFEEDWDTHQGDISSTAWKAKRRRAFERMQLIMQSVRIGQRVTVRGDAQLALGSWTLDPENPASALKEYRDPANGVSFSYSNTWNLNAKDTGGFFIPTILGGNLSASHVSVGILGQDVKTGPHKNSDFISAQFLYRAIPDSTQKECYAATQISDIASEDKVSWTTIGNTRFLHHSGGQQATCNSTREEVYANYQAGRCLLFESDLNMVCEDADAQPVTPETLKEIEGWLNDVMLSVRVEPSE